MRARYWSAALATLALSTFTAAPAQTPLTPTAGLDSGAGCFSQRCFMNLHALDGDTALTSNTGSGVAIQVRQNAGWAVQRVITNPDNWRPPTALVPSYPFGAPAFSGDSLLVAGTSPVYTGKHVVYVFARNGGNWNYVQHLWLGRPAGYDRTNVNRIASDGQWAVVSGTRVKDAADPQAFLQLDFYRLNANGTYSRRASHRPPIASNLPFSPIALGGNTMVIADPTADQETGRALVYDYDDERGWRLRWTLRPADLSPGARFGESIAVDGNVIVVGAPGVISASDPVNEGALYVFARTTSGWTQQQKIVPVEDPLTSYRLGELVDVSGDHIVAGKTIGANTWDLPSFAYVFANHGDSWVPAFELLHGPNTAELVTEVKISGHTVIATATDFAYGRPGHSYQLPR